MLYGSEWRIVRKTIGIAPAFIVLAAVSSGGCGSAPPRETKKMLSTGPGASSAALPNSGLDFTYNHQENRAMFTLRTRNPTSHPGTVDCSLLIDDEVVPLQVEPDHLEPESQVTLLINADLPPDLPLRILEDLEPACTVLPES